VLLGGIAVFVCFYVCGGIYSTAFVFTDLFYTLSPLCLSVSLSVSQVFWGTCINALIHSVILFWFPLKMLEHGK